MKTRAGAAGNAPVSEDSLPAAAGDRSSSVLASEPKTTLDSGAESSGKTGVHGEKEEEPLRIDSNDEDDEKEEEDANDDDCAICHHAGQ